MFPACHRPTKGLRFCWLIIICITYALPVYKVFAAGGHSNSILGTQNHH